MFYTLVINLVFGCCLNVSANPHCGPTIHLPFKQISTLWTYLTLPIEKQQWYLREANLENWAKFRKMETTYIPLQINDREIFFLLWRPKLQDDMYEFTPAILRLYVVIVKNTYISQILPREAKFGLASNGILTIEDLSNENYWLSKCYMNISTDSLRENGLVAFIGPQAHYQESIQYGFVVGQPGSVVVNISAYPAPSELTWYIGDIQVNGIGSSSISGHFTTSMVSIEDNVHRSSLHINNITELLMSETYVLKADSFIATSEYRIRLSSEPVEGFDIDSANHEHNKLSIIGKSTHRVNPENKYPWMAALMAVVDNIERQFCGGSVVHERHVVTAAHCVLEFDPVQIFVRLGEYQLSFSTGNEQDFTVDKIMIHERYYHNISSCNGDYDIAILRLSQPADLKKFPRIYLPMDMETSGNDRELVTVIGWGYTDIESYRRESDNKSDILLQHKTRILTSSDCFCHIPGYKPAMSICTRPTAGKGDSGGPLMIKKEYEGEEKYWLIGIVSRYVEFCYDSEDYNATKFVRTYYFKGWMYDKMLWG